MRRRERETDLESKDVRPVPRREEYRAVCTVPQPLSLVLRRISVGVVSGAVGCRPGLVWVSIDACEGVVRRGVFGVHLLHMHYPFEHISE